MIGESGVQRFDPQPIGVIVVVLAIIVNLFWLVVNHIVVIVVNSGYNG